METLREVKEWLMFKFQTGQSKQQEDNTSHKGLSALTPQNIPEFVIPGSGNSSRRTSSDCYGELDIDFERKRYSYGGPSFATSPVGSPGRLSPSGSTPCFQTVNRKPCMSAPVTPKHELRNFINCSRAAHSTPRLDHVQDGTNDDPLSFAAMSLPHFRMQTSYGFSTLTETPHTRRKESLFHMNSEGLLPRRSLTRGSRNMKSKRYNDHSAPDISLLNTGSITSACMPSTSMPSVIVTAAKQNSTSRSPSPDIYSFAAHCGRRLSPTYLYGNAVLNASKYNRFYNRRRSSLQMMPETGNGVDSSSASEASTPPYGSLEFVNAQQRHSYGELLVNPLHSPTIKRHSAPSIQNEKNIDEPPKQRSSSCDLISNHSHSPKTSHTHLFAPFGELKFSFQYLPASTQLKVTLIRAENLGGHQKQDRVLNVFAKLYLMPGKLQKQGTSVVKRNRNPVFNQEFYFHNIEIEKLRTMTLVIKIFSKSQNLKLNEFIGNVSIPLDNYDVMVENRIWKDLEYTRDREVSTGRIVGHRRGSILF